MPTCGKTFERCDNLIRHERTQHNEQRKTAILQGINENVKPYPCYICDKMYTTKFSVLRHIKRIICEVCWNELPGKHELRQHRLKYHKDC